MSTSPIAFYSRENIRTLESLAFKEGTSGEELMDRAGRAAFHFLEQICPEAKTIAVFCGSGNNGGDGYILAREAHKKGLTVLVRALGDIASHTKEAAHARETCQAIGLDIKPFKKSEAIQADVWIDALIGIGLDQDVEGRSKEAIELINRTHSKVLSMDLPSGIDADTGEIMGVAVKATWTITFLGIKKGFISGKVLDYCGELAYDDLHLSPAVFSKVLPVAWGIHDDLFSEWLPSRSRLAHKGTFGHVLVVGGGEGMSGAPRLAALGALRIGTGLITVATHPAHATILNAMQPEIMCWGMKSTSQLDPLLQKATVIVLGPGLGQSTWSQKLIQKILTTSLPLVVDADALNWLSLKPQYCDHWILTPHPGEAAKLLKTTIEEIEKDRLQAAQAIQKKYGGYCVLKGARTIIASPQEISSISLDGNPGMASGGVGDLLSGMIGGLIAQGLPLAMAAKLGVCAHAHAGDLAKMDGERGMIASDLLPWIRRIVNCHC